MFETEKLKIQWDGRRRISAPNKSVLYWGPFDDWWNMFGLAGYGMLVGDEGNYGTALKLFFRERWPDIKSISTVGLAGSDIDWDIIEPIELPYKYDWIICQAVLEHVRDPVSAVKNMALQLNIGGKMYLHSHGPKFAHHRHPLDCYRFMRDGVIALADLSNCKILDMVWNEKHWLMVAELNS